MSSELINLTVTTYLILQGLAPSLWGPVSDARGRRVAYIGTFVVFLGACVGLALCRSYAGLLVLRALQSTGSASTIAIGAGVVGDVTTRANRGGLMSIFQAGLLASIVVGPIIGGALAGSPLGWRSIFWFLTIYSGAFLLLLAFLLPETLRGLVGNGGRAPASLDLLARFPLSVYQRHSKVSFQAANTVSTKSTAPLRIDVLGPLRILVSRPGSPVIACLAVYYAVWQMSITALPTLFASKYGLSETQIGLTYLANGGGSILGTLVTGRLLNMDYRRMQERWEARERQQAGNGSGDDSGDNSGDNSGNDNAASEDNATAREQNAARRLARARLRLLPVFAALQCAAILVFGWTVDSRVAAGVATPIVATFVTGWAAVSAQTAVSTYLVDVYQRETLGAPPAGRRSAAAAANASLNLARCLCAAGGTSAVMPLVRRIGAGPAFSVCVGAQAVAAGGCWLAARW